LHSPSEIARFGHREKTSIIYRVRTADTGVSQMPWKTTLRKARQASAEGKGPSTQAGEFVREEIEHVRRGKHGARSAKQAIAIGLSKARRAGVKLPPPQPGRTSKNARRKAQLDVEAAKHPHKPARRRSRATEAALKREGRQAGSRKALSRQARSAASARGRRSRSMAAKKAAATRRSRRNARG
jgi:hypothetical protein